MAEEFARDAEEKAADADAKAAARERELAHALTELERRRNFAGPPLDI